MKKMIQSSEIEGEERVDNKLMENKSIVEVQTKMLSEPDIFEKKGHSWYATSHVPTDLSIQVQDVTFNVHKYPLVSRCDYLNRIRIELNPQNPNSNYDVKFENFPGGLETFEIILKFCYGLPISLNPDNIASLRCASEFLEMTEELEESNLISKTESFLTFVVLSSWKDSITVLKSCESLSPWCENLQIVRRCCESIAWKVSRENPNEGWWFDDVAILRVDHFTRIITATRAKGVKQESTGMCIENYVAQWLPGMDGEIECVQKYGKNEMGWSVISTGRRLEGQFGEINKEQKMIIESILSILPNKKEAVSCKFLMRMLKMSIVYSVSPALISDLEKRVGMVVENASISDLLVPNHTIGDQGKSIKISSSDEQQTMHNVDTVQRIFEYYLMHEGRQQQQQRQEISGKPNNVSKLLDNYLAEIAQDPNLSVTKFQVLADSLPDEIRTCHDGLYRAIDIYLKNHPSLPEHDRRRLCKVMECEKLSLDACMHAAHNDRLPLRTVIQVLLAEQVKMRAAMQGKGQIATRDNSDEEGNNFSSTKIEIKNLKTELEKVKEQMTDLQRDYAEIQQDYGKLNGKQRSLSGWNLAWRNIRSSVLFHKKVDIIESEEDQKSTPIGCRVSFRRRRSLA